MNILTLFFISLSLSGDAFALSVSNSIYRDNMNLKKFFVSSAIFGIMQGIMPCIGFYFGGLFTEFLAYAQKRIVLFILTALGINMIFGYIRDECTESKTDKGKLNLKTMFFQSIVTSIDAFSMGIGFAAMGINMLFTSLFIVMVTFILCMFGYLAGKEIKILIGNKAQLICGIILIIIGIKTYLN